MRGKALLRPFSGRLAATALLLAGLPLLASGEADAASSYIDFDRHSTYRALASGKEAGVSVRRLPGGAGSVRLQRGRTQGSLTSRVYRPSTRFDTLVPSWNASAPSGTRMQLEVAVHSGGRWSRWFNMGVWSQTARRHSVGGQSAGRWRVLTDTLQSRGRVFATAYRYRLKLSTSKRGRSPGVRSVFITSSNSYRHGQYLGVPALRSVWGRSLRVPQRSQMVYPNGGEIWCSPTSLSMVMAYWAGRTGNRSLDRTVPTVARGVRDYSYGWGNWPFNTAYASSLGLRASVNRFSSVSQAERWIRRGVPVVASIAWDNRTSRRRLSGAPLRWSDGHLLVVRGFTRSGDVIVNDPAARTRAGVRRVYDRAQFFRAWLHNARAFGNFGSSGIAYLVHPKSWRVPDRTYARGSW